MAARMSGEGRLLTGVRVGWRSGAGSTRRGQDGAVRINCRVKIG